LPPESSTTVKEATMTEIGTQAEFNACESAKDRMIPRFDGGPGSFTSNL
jgi:hypothetical protein